MTQEQVEAERQLFEAWHVNTFPHITLERLYDSYTGILVSNRFEVWLARAEIADAMLKARSQSDASQKDL